MDGARHLALALLVLCQLNSHLPAQTPPNTDWLDLPSAGSGELRVLTPSLLELTYVTAIKQSENGSAKWNFGGETGQPRLPKSAEFRVSVGKQAVGVTKVGFKRRVLYAPLKHWDLRVANWVYLVLDAPVPEGATVEVANPDGALWRSTTPFVCRADSLRFSPAVHVNQTGYVPAWPKEAMVGYYLGTLGELDLAAALAPAAGSSTNSLPFKIVAANSSQVQFEGLLKPRADRGFAFECYQKVFEADFSKFRTPGEYRLWVPGLGTSLPFRIGEEVAGAFARTYALGIYHQRCGMDNAMPFTRFTHGVCHSAPAEVPDMSEKFKFVNQCLAKMTEGWKNDPRHTAPQMKDVASCLYPFVTRGPVDVRGGHHDAGDYSKYTINSAAFVHHLIFAADAFPGAASLDNLGLPESGDGKSDLLEEAKWEADFLVKMQDDDGGFYFLVYPRDREYEDNVLPDEGDPQVVFPKTTSVTAAATAALAQCASSPAFKRQFPEAAAKYLAASWKGWAFLERALQRFGKDGSYQKITHYGDEFMHNDELAWAACELFLASGDPGCHKQLLEWLKPSDPETRRWGWWRLYDAYGCAIRSYAFAVRTGRLKREQVNEFLLEECENEIAAAGEDQMHRAEACAYGTSFPLESKRFLSAGWYFSGDAAFDLAVACQLDYPQNRDTRPAMMRALLSNLNYEQGCNPVNVTYLTGLGWHRQREIVDQYALNDRRILPPTGIPLGNVQAGFGWNYVYQSELGKLSFPSDGSEKSPYPFYDRWGDAFNLSQEFVIVNQARALGYLSWLMARTSLKNQTWKSGVAQIIDVRPQSQTNICVTLSCPETDLSQARIVWEAEGHEPGLGTNFNLFTTTDRCHWVEAEAQLPDGRRVFGVRDLQARPVSKGK